MTALELLEQGGCVYSRDGSVHKTYHIVHTESGLRVGDSSGHAYQVDVHQDMTGTFRDPGILAVAYGRDYLTIYADGRWHGDLEGVEFTRL